MTTVNAARLPVSLGRVLPKPTMRVSLSEIPPCRFRGPEGEVT